MVSQVGLDGRCPDFGVESSGKSSWMALSISSSSMYGRWPGPRRGQIDACSKSLSRCDMNWAAQHSEQLIMSVVMSHLSFHVRYRGSGMICS